MFRLEHVRPRLGGACGSLAHCPSWARQGTGPWLQPPGAPFPRPFSLLISRGLVFLNLHLILIIVVWKTRIKTNTMKSSVGKYFWLITLNSHSQKCFWSESLSSSGLQSPSVLRNSLCSPSCRLHKPFTGEGKFSWECF